MKPTGKEILIEFLAKNFKGDLGKRHAFIFVRSIVLFSLAGAFFYAGQAKLADVDGVTRSVRAFDLPLGGAERGVAWLLPSLEISCAVALLFKWTRRGALLLLGCLCIVFFFALIQATLRGFVVDCGCFGETETGNSSAWNIVWYIVRNLLFLGVIVWLYKQNFRDNISYGSSLDSFISEP